MEKPKSILALFENHPERWIKASFGRDHEGNPVSSIHPNAVSWCLLGALSFIYRDQTSKEIARAKLQRAIHPTFNCSLFYFNDTDERTFEEVLEVVRKAGV